MPSQGLGLSQPQFLRGGIQGEEDGSGQPRASQLSPQTGQHLVGWKQRDVKWQCPATEA